ncbi:hypothetical protein L484_012200 [Morus notabilis]|uniref:Uncharacterized protein n=1 Tax=Morus notabilis TaxID=981085 RepID=W9QN10_9ROSA|nr:hypothetical protein L484_012200 [Morus notabilis]
MQLQISTAWGIGLIIGPAIGGFFAQIFSLWAVSPCKFGGLNYTTDTVGEVLAISGYPFLASLSGLTLFLVLTVASVARNALSLSLVTGLYILQNRAVDQDQRGAANGLSMTGMSVFKAVGPAGAGAL